MNPAKTHIQFLKELELYNFKNTKHPLVLLKGQLYKNRRAKLKFLCKRDHTCEISPANLIGLNRGCSGCLSEKIQETNLQRYGIKFTARSPIFREKTKETNLRRYGHEYAVASIYVKNKINQTNLKKYGVEYPLQNKDVRGKAKQTNLKKYGVENPFQSKEIKDIIKQTNLKKYGVKYPQQNKKIQEKTKQTNLERYGVENPLQNKEVQEKTKQTNLERYGVENSNQKHYSNETLNKLRSFDWLYQEYITNNKTTTQISNELGIHFSTVCDYLRLYNIPIFKIVKFSKISIQWMESIMKKDRIYIQHAGNEGEYNIPSTRLLVDGYCKENNTVYEFYGDCWHGNLDVFDPNERCHPFDLEITAKELNSRTVERENKIKNLGYNVVAMWETPGNLS